MKAASVCLLTQVPRLGLTRILLCVFCSLYLTICNAAEPGPRDITASHYYMEFLTYKAQEKNETVLELFCEFPINYSYRFRENVGPGGKIGLTVTLYDPEKIHFDSITATDSVYIQEQHAASLLSDTYMRKFAFSLKPGNYVARIEVGDREAQSSFAFDRPIVLADYGGAGIKISDMHLSSQAMDEAFRALPVSMRRQITPNLSHIFGIERKTIYVYSEIYNLKKRDDGTEKNVVATYTIRDMNNHILSLKKYPLNVVEPVNTLDNAISVAGFPSGSYKLVLEIRKRNTMETTCKETIFHIINPWSFVSPDSYQAFVRQLRYIATPEQSASLSSMPEDKRGGRLQTFWKTLDPEPATDENEFMLMYLKRVYFANQYFDDLTSEGWETEQGEIYIVNGPPDKIDRIVSSTNSKLYEVWKYTNLQRKFVFVDNWGLGSFQLIKSTALVEPIYSLQ